ncbi:MAG TPA: DegV family protein [Firmicutes bacterium]|nr:DegV family protein [Bacillota bacterium]
MAIKIVTDSTSDIDREIQQKLDITIIPLTVHFPDESFVEGHISLEYFYSKLEKSPVIPTSSQPSSGDIQVVFERLIAQGHDIIAIFLSSKISGTYENALSARETILKQYPDAKIEIIDSLNTAMALGYPVIEIAREAQAGRPFEELTQYARQLIDRMRFYFVPATLEYLRKGGRIGSAAALVGSILDLKPVLYYANGLTAVAKKVRSMRGAVKHMLRILEADCQKHGLQAVIVQHINSLSKAKELAQTIKDKYNMAVSIVAVGPVVGLHVGPGTLGIMYCLARSSQKIT